MSKHPFQRAHYRIRYPVSARPVFLMGPEQEHPVVDCSEKGLRYRPPGGTLPEIGAEVAGSVLFQNGERVEVAGVVVRIQEGEVAVHLTRREIPWRVIFEEQRFLRQRYPLSLLLE